ncbi:SSI family serine proteinase inhibitor [Nocardiopsis alkaliphila]|uniref:SSI family serine proteinase inhibitor n=1 Tax=Nocardiopsis alkaliphila TaxID=225762 RepID=UPI00034915EA|nr:SSI family serine proteinase inhibitor [Nocardiopsis alkaliphila]
MRTALTLAATAALALSLATPAQAATDSYELIVQGAPEYRGETSKSWVRSMTLECGPAGGRHPRAEEACELIDAAGGSIADVRVREDGFCPMVHRPVTAIAIGGGGRYEETFGNDCLLEQAKGAIFDF